MLSDIEIAQAAKLKRIDDLAHEWGLTDAEFEPYGRDKAKVKLASCRKPHGKLILVTATSGMPAGSETLVSVRVGDTMLTVKELGSTHYASDEPVYLGFNPKKVNVFETKSENLIKYCV